VAPQRKQGTKPAPGREALGPGLTTPARIQDFLSGIPYDDAPGTASPLRVARERRANCFEGALFAAAALRQLGFAPLIVDLYAVNDDDHVVAVFQRNGAWGAVAKSNTTMLRYRDPIYRDLRELVMSYFEGYFNIHGVKTLRSYSRPLDLRRFDRRQWMTTDGDLGYIGDQLNLMPHIAVVSVGMARSLRHADRDQRKACFLGSVRTGLYQAKPPKGEER
jgi:hypothetical protein